MVGHVTGVASAPMIATARDAGSDARPRAVAWSRALVAPVAAGVSALVVLLAGWQGADWPAQIFRTEMFEADGLTVWNNHWYGGHHSVGYSLLLPPLAALLGTSAVAVGSAVVATSAVQELLGRLRRGSAAVVVGATLFGIGLAANVAVGRLPFLLGVAVATVSLVCWAEGHLRLATALAALSGLASPVAALFLGIAAGGRSMVTWRTPSDVLRVGDVRGQGPLLTGAAMVPVLLVAVIFPAGGSFPFASGGFVLSVVVLAGVWLSAGRGDREVRAVVAFALVAVVAAMVLPTPLGGNIVRLPMFFALPVLVTLLWARRRRVVPLIAAVLLAWAWWPAGDAVLWAADDPTRHASFFAPMIQVVSRDAIEPARVEIPFTRRHWEAAYVAPVLPLARGWERQLDRRVNPVFYEDDGLSALEYHVWLRENAVQYVALPDVELDPSAEAEAALLEQGQPFLRPVWENEDWRVWALTDSESLVEGDAELLDLAADRILIDAAEAGELVVRVRFSPHWSVEGPTCVAEDEDGWTVLHVAEPGEIELVISPAALAGVSDATADPCDEG